MNKIYINSPLSININNTKLDFSLNEEVFGDLNKSFLSKDNFMLKLSNGMCSINNFNIQSYNNINYTIYLDLSCASDGKQKLEIEIKGYNELDNAIIINELNVYLNKEYLLFDENSIIKTDQGLIKINNLKPIFNTINLNKIIKITKAKKYDNNNLILVKKNTFGNNKPNIDTILTYNQKIFYNNNYVKLSDIYFESDNKLGLVILKNNNDNYLYNILIDNISKINLNNLDLELQKNYNIQYYEESFYDFNIIKDIITKNIDEKFNEFKNNFLYDYNKTINELNLINNNLKFNNTQLIPNNDNNNNNNNNNNDLIIRDNLIWDHWIKYGEKENKILDFLVTFENADFEKYKKDYPFISKTLNYDNNKIFEHWKDNGFKENKKMYIKVTFENADYQRFKNEYPDLIKNLNNNNEIWKYYNDNINNNINLYPKLNINNANFYKFRIDYPNLCLRIKKNYNKNN